MNITGSVKHRFVCSDPASGCLVWVDGDGKILRTVEHIKGCFEVWELPGGEVLYPHFGKDVPSGFTILDQNGNVLRTYETQHEVFGVQPLPDGNILVGELGQKRMVEVSPDGSIVKEIPIAYEGKQHECLRMVRKTENAYFAVLPGVNEVRRYTLDGILDKTFSIRPDAFGVIALEHGGIVYTCMEGAFELDADGNEIWSLTDADVPEMNIRWLLGIQRLKNGNYVFSNWMGHKHRDEGIHFFEVDRQKNVVWSFDGRGTLLEPATLQILDEDAAQVCYRPMR
ncbi:MAG: hypothetical protein IJX19_08265 [Clostridia bacterium]|nr:hypothetical protein [Clostridia bacterium]